MDLHGFQQRENMVVVVVRVAAVLVALLLGHGLLRFPAATNYGDDFGDASSSSGSSAATES